MLQCCVRLRRLSSSVTLCIEVKWCVLEQKLLLSAYRKSYMRNRLVAKWMIDLDLCLEVVWRSGQPLRYIWRWICRKALEIEAWFQRTTNRKWYMGYRMTDDVTWPWKVKLVTRIRLERNISKTAGDRDSVPKEHQEMVWAIKLSNMPPSWGILVGNKGHPRWRQTGFKRNSG